MTTIVRPMLQILSPQLIHNTHPDRLRWSNAKVAAEKVGADLPALPPPKLSSLYSPAECPPAKIGGCDGLAPFRPEQDMTAVVERIDELKERGLPVSEVAVRSLLYVVEHKLHQVELCQLPEPKRLSIQSRRLIIREVLQRTAVKKHQLADRGGRTARDAAADVARSLAEFEALLGTIVHVTVAPARCDKLCFGLCAENPLTCHWLRWQQALA
jgi:hypothetical protein